MNQYHTQTIFSKSVGNFLEGPLFDEVRRLAQLEQDVRAYLPPAIRGQISTGGLRGQAPHAELVLIVTSSSVATRVRQNLPSLLRYLQSKGWNLSGLRIRMQPDLIVDHDKNRLIPRKQAMLSVAGLDSLKDLQSSLTDSPLRNALSALLARYVP
ncbi:MAG: DUF721 domain-containing protein [Ottowia sp.]|nr:DUF721 domain-containing protein [Ottowia sp.]